MKPGITTKLNETTWEAAVEGPPQGDVTFCQCTVHSLYTYRITTEQVDVIYHTE